MYMDQIDVIQFDLESRHTGRELSYRSAIEL
jgi:hypothetical protein